MAAEVTVVVDAANVVGSRPDGWWRDRAGAARRLRDALSRMPGQEVEIPSGGTAVVVLVVLVVEGSSRVVAADESPAGIRTVAARRSGDDEVLAQAERAVQAVQAGGAVLVVTADRALRQRVRDIGALVAGPSWLWDLLGDG